MAQNSTQEGLPELLSPQGLADLIDVPLATVYAWNYKRTGPPMLKLGRHVRYRRADVDAWLERNAQPNGAA